MVAGERAKDFSPADDRQRTGQGVFEFAASRPPFVEFGAIGEIGGSVAGAPPDAQTTDCTDTTESATKRARPYAESGFQRLPANFVIHSSPSFHFGYLRSARLNSGVCTRRFVPEPMRTGWMMCNSSW